jgi:oxepin-CoA hydrolase/3-oxo-5,6-dehydrosuberyl-CoA semialdehyde dehydrogenase
MQEQQLAFIKNDMFLLAGNLSTDSKAAWGKMNPQQMIEHVADFFDVSTEKIKFPLTTPEEHLPKYKAFLYSDKEFKENTKAPAAVLGEVPLPLRTANLEAAINKLKMAVDDFFSYFKNDPNKLTMHPAFGLLNFDEWIMLHYKHVVHHWKQFGLIQAV